MSEADRLDAIVVTNGAVRLMRDWASGPVVEEYSLDTRCFEVPMRSSAGRGVRWSASPFRPPAKTDALQKFGEGEPVLGSPTTHWRRRWSQCRSLSASRERRPGADRRAGVEWRLGTLAASDRRDRGAGLPEVAG